MEVKREPIDPQLLHVRNHSARQLLRGGDLYGLTPAAQLEGDELSEADLERHVAERVMTTTLDKAVAWARSNSFFPATFGLACCAIEMMSIVAARVDVARFGFEAFRASPRQADLLILSGRVSIKMAPIVRRIYDQMLEPKWAISMGACCSSMGVFNNYALVPADKFMPIDVHVPGCPPRPEALMHGVLKLRKRSARRRSLPPRTSTAPTSTSRPRETRLVPDATGLELIARELRATRELGEEAILGTLFFRDRATLIVKASSIRAVLSHLRERGYAFLASVHGVDYYPQEPRLGVHYELLDMSRVDRITVQLRVPTAAPVVESVTVDWPTANHQEREVYDMFGVVFDGHPDLRRILMPEDYEGYPQRRDFPIGGEPVIFTYNERQTQGSAT
jgi:NADH-quinone oxidoreductase B subunit/NADH/F420H2 dehydrogenase subunit C